MNWLANCGHQFTFQFCFEFLRKGGSNQSIVVIVTTFASIINGITFYFAFGEKLSITKMIGMLCSISAVVFLALSKQGEEVKTVQAGPNGEAFVTDPKYTYIAIGMAFIVPVCFSTKHFFTRLYSG